MGLSSPAAGRYDKNSQARDLAAVLDRLKIGQNVRGGVIAHSGHWIMEAQPKKTVAAVRQFIDAT